MFDFDYGMYLQGLLFAHAVFGLAWLLYAVWKDGTSDRVRFTPGMRVSVALFAPAAAMGAAALALFAVEASPFSAGIGVGTTILLAPAVLAVRAIRRSRRTHQPNIH